MTKKHIVSALLVNIGCRLFGLSFFGYSMPGIPFLSDFQINAEPIINEINHEDFINRKKRKARQNERGPRRGVFSRIIPGRRERKRKQKISIDIEPRIKYGIRSPGTVLIEFMEEEGLNVAQA